MIVYAIRQKSTGFYLPSIKRSNGFTSTIPIKAGIPRLFISKRGATNAMRWWLQGEWTAYRSMSDLNGDSDYGIKVTFLSNRNSDDMEVVELVLSLV